jgi:hypothetical protein
VVSGIGFHPVLVIVAAAAEHFLFHHHDLENLTKEVDDMLGPRQATEIAMDDETVSEGGQKTFR